MRAGRSCSRIANVRQSATELGEHLGLLARWYFSSPREGEIFFREKDWPYRRILRGCSRLLNPKKEQETPGNKPKDKTQSEENK